MYINTQNKPKKTFLIYVFLLFIVIGYIVYAMVIKVPKIEGHITEVKVASPNISDVVWPEYGQSAIGAKGYGSLASHGEQKSVPIASIAKTILAISVLREKPLNIGEQGPLIKITETDVNFYKEFLSLNGSVVPVKLNDELSEYQMLQALMLPSGDNIADTLAIWAFGSIENYLTYANKMVTELGLSKTKISDPSGLSPKTVSSAEDLIVVGELALENPVLAEIVNQKDVTLPVAGLVKNYNTLLGQNGVIGIKTGNTDEAGGCLLFASKKIIDGKEVILIGVILGATSRAVVLNDTNNFLNKNISAFKFVDVVKKGQVFGFYDTPWKSHSNIVAGDDLTILAVNKENISIDQSINSVNTPIEKNSEIGNILVKANLKSFNIPLIIEKQLDAPSVFWKITHPRR